MNLLFSLITQAKKKGKGTIGNGRIYVRLMSIIADKNTEITSEENILRKFNNDIVIKESYRKLERYLSRFQRDGKGYPYELYSFNDFINSSDKSEYYHRVRAFIDEIIEDTKTDSLIYTLLEILKNDDDTEEILYGNSCIPKDNFIGSAVHRKRICPEVFITGCLYHAHKQYGISSNIKLISVPETKPFRLIRYIDLSSLNTEIPVSVAENIKDNSNINMPVRTDYRLEFEYDNKTSCSLPEKRNLFIYGSGGIGKTTVLSDMVNQHNGICLYLPLYSYKSEMHTNISDSSIGILLSLLLKYHYQYEYRTYDTLCTCEGENEVIKQLVELENLFKSVPFNNEKKYTLLLDGCNEIQEYHKSDFYKELEYILDSWKNVRIIVSGRNVPNYDISYEFTVVKICGVEKELVKKFTENEDLREILRSPMMLKMYTSGNNNDLNTTGEILHRYFENSFSCSDITEMFLVKYVLPFIANSMFHIWFRNEISRADVYNSAEQAVEFFMKNNDIYQNFIAPKGYNKKSLLESREGNDWVSLLLNTGLIEISCSDSKMIHFSHQYYRNYFAARYVINLIDSAASVYDFLFGELPKSITDSDLFDQWYGSFACTESNDVYVMIGEILGDYKNKYTENFTYTPTKLDLLLDMARDNKCRFAAENVIRTMAMTRDNVICGADFSHLKYPMFISNDILFSHNGDYPCDFRYCTFPPLPASTVKGFKGCDFTGSLFIFEKTKEFIIDNGGIFLTEF